MYSPNNDSGDARRPRLHPLIATAAVAVIVLSAVGVTAMVMNHSSATTNPYDAPAPAVAAAVERPAPVTNERAYDGTSAIRPSSTPRTPVYDAPPAVAQAAPICRDCGVVDSIRDIKVKGQGTGVGAVGGAVVGGLLGNMVGAGRGKALATVAGAVGGGLGGNAIEKNVRSEIEHQMVVRLDDGGTRTFTQATPFPYREGERVRVVDGHVQRG